MKARYLPIGVVSLFVACMLTVPAYADIDSENVVGIWRFDENEGEIALDSSEYGNDGKLMNGPARVPGKFGGALEFDGVDDYVDCGNEESLAITTSMTIMGWVKPGDMVSALGWHRFAARGEYDTGWMLGITNTGKPDLTVTNSGGGFVTMYGLTTTEVGTWYHIAGVVDSEAKRVYIYLNGELDNDPLEHSGEMMDPNVPMVLGKSGMDNRYVFHGVVDEVMIFNVALSEDDIKNIMDNGFEGVVSSVSPESRLVTVWGEIKAK